MKAVEIRALNYLRHRKVYRSWHKEIRDEFWSNSVTRRLWQFIRTSFKEAGPGLRAVAIQSMEEWVESHSFQHKDRYAQALERMRKIPFEPNDRSVLTFLQRRRFKSVLDEGAELLDSAEGLDKLASVRTQLDKLVKLSSREKHRPLPYFDSVTKRTGAIRTDVLQSGLSTLFDRKCGGGIGVGDLFVFLGATNTGKTAVLCNVAAQALKQGNNVLYFTLDDLSSRAIARRVDQILLGATEEQIVSNPNTYVRKITRLKERGFGDLFIHDYNDRDASVLDVQADVEDMLDKGVKIDVLVVDYVDVMVSADQTKDEQRVFLQICRGLKRIGRERKLRVWTAGQGNRQAIDADEIKLSQMAGAIAKAKSADVVFGINQTEDQRKEDLMRLTCLRSRVFRRWDDEVWMATDWETMRITGIRDD